MRKSSPCYVSPLSQNSVTLHSLPYFRLHLQCLRIVHSAYQTKLVQTKHKFMEKTFKENTVFVKNVFVEKNSTVKVKNENGDRKRG